MTALTVVFLLGMTAGYVLRYWHDQDDMLALLLNEYTPLVRWWHRRLGHGKSSLGHPHTGICWACGSLARKPRPIAGIPPFTGKASKWLTKYLAQPVPGPNSPTQREINRRIRENASRSVEGDKDGWPHYMSPPRQGADVPQDYVLTAEGIADTLREMRDAGAKPPQRDYVLSPRGEMMPYRDYNLRLEMEKLVAETGYARTTVELIHGFALQAWQHRNLWRVTDYLSMLGEFERMTYGKA